MKWQTQVITFIGKFVKRKIGCWRERDIFSEVIKKYLIFC